MNRAAAEVPDVRPFVKALQGGDVVCLPTETGQTLACGAYDEAAVAEIQKRTGRPREAPLPVAFHSWRAAQVAVVATPLADRLAQRFLPGPVSLVLERRDPALADLAPGLDSLRVLVPAHEAVRRILDAAGPLVMVGAHSHGQRGSTGLDAVCAAYPDLPVLEGSSLVAKRTVVDARGDVPEVLREGLIARQEVEASWP